MLVSNDMARWKFNFSVTAVLVSAIVGCQRPVVLQPAPVTRNSPLAASPMDRVVGPLNVNDAAALATMTARVNAYRTLRQRIISDIGPLTPGTPRDIDVYQRAIEARLRSERRGARQGDIFTLQSQPVIKRLLAAVFAQPDGQQILSSITDVTVSGVALSINGRYPDSAAVSTMPPQVLQTLPELGEGLQYRFVGGALILFDSHARIILDFILSVL
jgi:hypothetical protein